MNFKEDELVQYTEMVWSSLLGLTATRSHEAYLPDPMGAESCLQISGSWVGVVTINCPDALVNQITEVMFQLEPGSASIEEVQDAMGEVINMIGGNLKALMPPPCYVSLPIVAIGGHSLQFPMTQIVCKITMKCQDQLFQISLREQKESRFSKKTP